MSNPIGMRIPPKIGAEGIRQTALWAAEAGLDILDVPQLTPEVKQACEEAGIGIGSVDAQQTAKLLSRDDSVREAAVTSVKQQMEGISELGGSVMFMCLVPEDHTLPRRRASLSGRIRFRNWSAMPRRRAFIWRSRAGPARRRIIRRWDVRRKCGERCSKRSLRGISGSTMILPTWSGWALIISAL